MPWLIAGFLVMLFLVPFDGVTFKVHLPMDAKPDRVLIGLMIAVWLAQKVTGTLPRPRRRRTAVERAVLVYTSIMLVSIVLNVDRIFQLNELTFAEKRLSQMLGYIIFFFIVISAVRITEIANYAKLILVLSGLTALGALYEAHSGINLFYTWTAKLLSPIATVIPPATNIHPPGGDRPIVIGPTAHGLALASMLTIALPFAVLPLLERRKRLAMSKRLTYLVLIGLILAAELATGRKTAVVAPIAAFAVLIAYNRRLLRWAPIAVIILIPVIHVAAPGQLGTVADLLGTASGSASTQARVSDYFAVAPDILNHLILGSGYGTLNADNHRWYRILDNEYLDELFQVGFLGLLAYLAIVITALSTAHRVIKSGGVRAPPALAAAAGCAAFGVVSATFDAASFPQAPYTFLFAAALIVVAAVASRTESAREQVQQPLFNRYRRFAAVRPAPTAVGWRSTQLPVFRSQRRSFAEIRPAPAAGGSRPPRRRGGSATPS